MNIKTRYSIPVVFALLVLAFACAKQEHESSRTIEQRSFDAWMEKYHGDDPAIIHHDNGMYTKVLKQAPAGAVAPEAEDWVEIRYTGYAMPDFPINKTGNLFVTRDSLLAAQAGSTGVYRTHYAPEKLYMGYGSNLTEAMYETILLMKEGEKRMVYAPSFLAYGSSSSSTIYSYGYQGTALPAGSPCYMEIELVRVIKDVEKDESEQVDLFASHYLGLGLADTLKTGLYLKRLPNDVTADSVNADSALRIYYVGTFLDGFVFDTNIDSIAQRAWGSTTKYTYTTYTPSSKGWVDAFYEALPTMTYDSWGEMVFTSTYGYGYTRKTPGGSSTGDYGSVFDSYTPLFFKFYIMPHYDYDEP